MDGSNAATVPKRESGATGEDSDQRGRQPEFAGHGVVWFVDLVGQVAIDPKPNIHELITARRAELGVQIDELNQQLQAAREELQELATPRARSREPHGGDAVGCVLIGVFMV